jgi:hypothetical protein
LRRLAIFVALAVTLPVLVMLGASFADIISADNETITSQAEAGNSSTSDDIYGLRIANINKNGADFYWSTSVATNGSIDYGYTKQARLYNPQSSGSPPSVLITVNAMLVKSDSHWVKDHHIKVDNLDMSYDPFVQYTIKSATPSGDVYTLSGEFVLVDTQVLHWWQSMWYAIFAPIFGILLGVLAQTEIVPRIRQARQSRKAKKATVRSD